MIATDGNMYVGVLEGYDHSTNIAIRDASHRIISEESCVDRPIGLFVIRGDCVSLIGKTDPDLETKIDWTAVRGKPLRRIR